MSRPAADLLDTMKYLDAESLLNGVISSVDFHPYGIMITVKMDKTGQQIENRVIVMYPGISRADFNLLLHSAKKLVRELKEYGVRIRS